ncbi:unnamed protein product [Brassica rapa]|uniref:S12 n=1 Tax=Brassica campestris TaxID=3711 RepID=A0A8D9D5W2_BRACM|nr:unnamed protein product [Brassica rapa]
MKFGEGSRNKQNSKAPEGNVLCYCGLSGKISQAWIDKNPGQRSYGKYKPLAGASHAKGIILELIGMKAKQPNYGICKCVRIQLVKNGKKIAAFVPNDGCLNLIEPNDEVFISGFGRKGHAVGDIP